MAERTRFELAEPARIRVISGARPQELIFERGRPLRATIGSDPSASLCIERRDVAPRQLDVIWDGSQLWLQDGLRLGRTFLNGRTLNEWTPVVGQATACFGGVHLWVVAHTAAPRSPVPDFAALDRARLNDAHHSPNVRLKETGRFTLPPELMERYEPDAR